MTPEQIAATNAAIDNLERALAAVAAARTAFPEDPAGIRERALNGNSPATLRAALSEYLRPKGPMVRFGRGQWPAPVAAAVWVHCQLLRAGDDVGAQFCVEEFPDGLEECNCGNGEIDGPDGTYQVCPHCDGYCYTYDAPEGAGETP